MTERTRKIILITISAILFAVFVFTITIAVATHITGTLIDWSDAGDFFNVFSNTLGLAIAAAASVIAIILASNSQRSAEIQTTTVALQEFRGEIDNFVNLANQYYGSAQRIIDLTLELYDISIKIAEHCENAENGDVLAADAYDAAVHSYDFRLAKFREEVGNIQALLTGSGNFFFRRMMEENFNLYSGYVSRIIKGIQMTDEPPMVKKTDGSETYERDKRAVSPQTLFGLNLQGGDKISFPTISQLGKLSQCPALLAVPTYESYEYYDRMGRVSFMREEIEMQAKLYDKGSLCAIQALAELLPCMPSNKDYDFEGFIDGRKTDLDRALSDLESGAETHVGLSEKSANSYAVYADLLPFYLAMANPKAGIEQIRKTFESLNADQKTLHLSLDIHSARLRYTYEVSTEIFFADCVKNSPKS